MLLSIEQFQELLKEDQIIVLDTRTLDDLKLGYIPNAIHAPKHQIGKLIAMGFIQLDSPIILIAPNGAEQEALTIFEQLGFSNIKGVLNGGFESWIQAEKKFDILIDVDVDELAMDIPFDEYLMILDVRTEDQYQESHIKSSISLPLVELADPGSMSELDEHFNIYIISDNGEDAGIASTILKKQGIHNNRIVNDGWEAVQFLKDKFKFDKIKAPKESDDNLDF
jgi:rhodanese-related sulfurtransferase